MIILTGGELAVADVVAVARERVTVSLSPRALEQMRRGREVIDKVIERGEVVYGVNTGFGQLSRVRIPAQDLETLQHNLIVSHAAGVGEPLEAEVVRAMLLLLAASLARGHSGVRPLLAERLVELLNADLLPVVPSRGSCGASGDLAPLAHLAQALIGEGEVLYHGARCTAALALQQQGLAPLRLAPKEGLALINGTHLMAALGALAVHDAAQLVATAEVAAAISLEALRGTDVPFDARIHDLRPQRGQAQTAAHLRRLLERSEILPSHRDDDPRVQDPYTLRCIPQVIGAVRDAIAHCTGVISAELAAVTDNPLCFPDDDAVLSGGNFHGQPLSLALDILALAIAELAAFSERRTYLLLDDREPKQNRLPAFLAHAPGLNSGYMIAQYTAASLVAENGVLATPAGLHSVPTSAGMEDFVSMGATAAVKARRILSNASQIIAIELLCASEGVEFRRPLRAGCGAEEAIAVVRSLVPSITTDRSLAPAIHAVCEAVQRGAFSTIGG